MLALEEWGKGRDKLLVMMAHSTALAAEPAFNLCVKARESAFKDFLANVEDEKAWLANYRNQSVLFADAAMVGEVLEVFAESDADREKIPVAVEFLEELRVIATESTTARKRRAATLAKECKEEGVTWSELFEIGKEIHNLIDDVYAVHLKTIELETEIVKESSIDGVALLRCSPRVRFFLLVTLPCWIEYQVSPTQLFAACRAGDFDALCRLVNLDVLCLQDTRVRRSFQNHMKTDWKRIKLSAAMAGQPLRKLNRKSVKILLAALVYKMWSEYVENVTVLRKMLWKKDINLRSHIQPLSFPALQKLFDSVYQDTHGDSPDDPDFVEQMPEAFRKGVQRHLDFWSIAA